MFLWLSVYARFIIFLVTAAVTGKYGRMQLSFAIKLAQQWKKHPVLI